MAPKKLTIFLVPEGMHRVKQFTVPRFLPAFLIFLCISCTVFLSWMIRDYHAVKSRMPRLAQLEKETELQKRQFIHMTERIDLVTHKMSELDKFDHKLRVMVNLDVGSDEEGFPGVGGSSQILVEPYAAEKPHRELVRMMHSSLDVLEKEMLLGEQGMTELYEFLKDQKNLLASTPSVWPVRGWVSSGFGYRTSPFTGEREFHKGIDISTREGTPIVAPANGIVSYLGWEHGYGKIITITHGHGLVTRYAHLKKGLVKKGQHVKRGETIALVGNTGRSTGPHLHYEVHVNRVRINPFQYILN